VLEDLDGCRRVAPRCRRVYGGNWDVAVELLKTSAANNCDMDGTWVVSMFVKEGGRKELPSK
jgi:hypothetical protein